MAQLNPKLLASNSSGFTLIELLVAISISVLLVGLGLAGYIDFNQKQAVVAVGNTVKTNLWEVRNKAQSGLKPESGCTTFEAYRVMFTQTNFQAQPVCDGSGLSYDTTYNLPTDFTFNPPSSGTEFDFRLLGQHQTLSQEVVINGTDNKHYSFCLSGSGDITDCGYYDGAVPPSCTC